MEFHVCSNFDRARMEVDGGYLLWNSGGKGSIRISTPVESQECWPCIDEKRRLVLPWISRRWVLINDERNRSSHNGPAQADCHPRARTTTGNAIPRRQYIRVPIISLLRATTCERNVDRRWDTFLRVLLSIADGDQSCSGVLFHLRKVVRNMCGEISRVERRF